jgi:NADH dehydrogenase
MASSLAICILGGTGFVGSRLAQRLLQEGHRVTLLTRNAERHKALRVVPGLVLEECDVYDQAALGARFRGQSVVINLVGILNETGFGGAGFRRAHTELTRRALLAARSAGVARFLQMSSLKADPAAPSHYLRSKGEAERLIASDAGALDWTIFQPSVIFGPGDSFLNRFAALLGALPLVFPLAKADARFQPVFVDDVVAAFVRAVHGGATSRQTLQLGGPRVYSLREIVAFVASATGKSRLIIGLPDWVARLQARVFDFVPGRPFSSDNFKSLSIDSVCTQDGFAALGIDPQAMEGVARQYLGSFEDNARLSRDRMLAGRDAG